MSQTPLKPAAATSVSLRVVSTEQEGVGLILPQLTKGVAPWRSAEQMSAGGPWSARV